MHWTNWQKVYGFHLLQHSSWNRECHLAWSDQLQYESSLCGAIIPTFFILSLLLAITLPFLISSIQSIPFLGPCPTGCPKKMVILSGFEFMTLGGVFLGVKNNSENFPRSETQRWAKRAFFWDTLYSLAIYMKWERPRT